MRGVLSGDRTYRGPRSRAGYVVFAWTPVLVMLAVIARESTEGFSGLHTSSLLRPLWERVFGLASDQRWEVIHHILRKCGHFGGYGMLGLAWLRAWLLQWLAPLRLQAARVWERWGFQMAICCTALVASADELHQTFLPDRTGLMQDVLLDTTGALVLSAAFLLFWTRKGQLSTRST